MREFKLGLGRCGKCANVLWINRYTSHVDVEDAGLIPLCDTCAFLVEAELVANGNDVYYDMREMPRKEDQ